jgi:hypothetical protein
VDALHDGGYDLGSASNELVPVYGEAQVSVGIFEISLFEIFFEGFEVVEEGIGGFVRGLFWEVRLLEGVGDLKRRR